MTRRMLPTTLALFAVLLPACHRGRSEPAPVVRVAAAADLTVAFEEIGRAMEARGGPKVSFTFGSTGLLARQLRDGAPFDVFAAAKSSFVDDVTAAGVCDASTKTPYARGRVVLWSRKDGVAPPVALADLADARFKKIALANPEHAPYGQAAREALRSAGLWATVEPRVVYGENVRQALQLAETGNVEVAAVALALVVSDRVNPWLLLDDGLHRPIEQAMVVCTLGAARTGGGEFVRFVASEPGRAIMRRNGLVLPGEEIVRGP